MTEKKLFGNADERGEFENTAAERGSQGATTRDALTPVVVLLIVSPTLVGTCFI